MPVDYHFEKYTRTKPYRQRRPLRPNRLREYLSHYSLASDVIEYFIKIESFPRVSIQEEAEYFRRIESGDSSARQKLILSKLRNVRPIILRQLDRRIDPWDMIQIGNQ